MGAAAVAVLVGFLALVIDVGSWYGAKLRLQAAADAAAYAAVQELGRSGSGTDAVIQAGLEIAADNGFAPDKVAVVPAADGKSVAVTISDPGAVFFSNALLSEAPRLSAHAAAAILRDDPPCMVALAPTGPDAVFVNGSSGIRAPACKLQINSTDPEALRQKGNGRIDAASICVAGGASIGKASNVTPPPETNCGTMADPLADLQPPTYDSGRCDTPGSFIPNGAVFCGGLTISGHVTLESNGLFVVKNGPLDVQGGTLEGSNVTIFLTGANARFIAGSNATVRLTAKTSGPYAGVVIYQDRNATGNLVSEFGGNSDKHYEGTLYFPAGSVAYSGTGSGDTPSPYSIFIAQRFTFGGNGSLSMAAQFDQSLIPTPTGFGRKFALVE